MKDDFVPLDYESKLHQLILKKHLKIYLYVHKVCREAREIPFRVLWVLVMRLSEHPIKSHKFLFDRAKESGVRSSAILLIGST